MNRLSLFILILLLIAQKGNAQQSAAERYRNDVIERLNEKELQGRISLEMDSLILENYEKHLFQNYKHKGISGYRIRIFSDNGQGAKEDQKRVRASFLSLYPEVDVYYRYEGSYYKVYVGDFRTRADAIIMLNKMHRNFPDAFIVEDDIIIDE